MFEEWFEKQAKVLGITTVRQSDREIEIELPKEISQKIEGDKFFIKAYNINPRFRLKYLHEQVIVALTLLNQKEHFLYYGIIAAICKTYGRNLCSSFNGRSNK